MRLRQVEVKNRVVVSPMGMYAAEDGYVTPFHLVHYGAFAMGGAGLVFMEQTSVTRDGRISSGDPGMWEDGQIAGLAEIVRFLQSKGAKAGIQLNHGGRKCCQRRAADGGGPMTERAMAAGEERWRPIGPSAKAFADGWQTPIAMTPDHIEGVRDAFVAACRRAVLAGFDVIELHMAHGYLLQSFLTPLANERADAYGGSLENRMRFPLEVAAAVRGAIPASMPLFARISVTDWVEGGWTPDESVVFARALKAVGVDLIDCSSGGNMLAGATNASLSRGRGYQVQFSERIRSEADVPTGAVGMIRTPGYAEDVLRSGKADLVFLGRQLLFNPFWAHHAAEHFGLTDGFERWPSQYGWWLNKWSGAVRAEGEALFDSHPSHAGAG
jgi:2,4-dienoyl-CoA reductase-like NADH-dependent reductase (Old Yellow Enzyme family)